MDSLAYQMHRGIHSPLPFLDHHEDALDKDTLDDLRCDALEQCKRSLVFNDV